MGLHKSHLPEWHPLKHPWSDACTSPHPLDLSCAFYVIYREVAIISKYKLLFHFYKLLLLLGMHARAMTNLEVWEHLRGIGSLLASLGSADPTQVSRVRLSRQAPSPTETICCPWACMSVTKPPGLCHGHPKGMPDPQESAVPRADRSRGYAQMELFIRH